MKKPEEKPNEGVEAEVWNAIAAFEQILDAIPNDRASLEALWSAYEQLGDYTKAKDYLVRLGNVLVDEGDLMAAVELLDKVKSFADDDPAAAGLVARIEGDGSGAHVAPAVVAPSAQQPSTTQRQRQQAHGADGVRTTFNMADELSFAWSLLEAKQLTDEEYANVVKDLTEMSAVESATTVSVLHVLESRAFKNLEKIIAYVAKNCGTPIVSLASFELKADEVGILPVEFMVGRGAVVFSTLGRAACCVVMNPYDKQLKKDIEAIAGKKCYFFVSLPSEFDQAVGTLASQMGGSAK